MSEMSLELIQQNALAIREASKAYELLVNGGGAPDRVSEARQYMLRLAYQIQQLIDEERQHVGGE